MSKIKLSVIVSVCCLNITLAKIKETFQFTLFFDLPLNNMGTDRKKDRQINGQTEINFYRDARTPHKNNSVPFLLRYTDVEGEGDDKREQSRRRCCQRRVKPQTKDKNQEKSAGERENGGDRKHVDLQRRKHQFRTRRYVVVMVMRELQIYDDSDDDVWKLRMMMVTT